MSGEEEEWKQQIPPGFRFAPTDVELIQHYLLPKVKGQFILPGIIHDDVNVYDCNPFHLPGMVTEEEFTYFFTKRGRKHPNGTRNDRLTKDGKGFWKSTSKKTQVFADDQSYLGNKNTLVYYVKNPKAQKDYHKTNWIMHEFELADKQFSDFVVCRVYNRQVKDKGDSNELKDLIGPNPVMSTHNNGELPVLPSAKRKFEPNMETCDHPHDNIAMAMNSNYFYGSHDLQAAAILGNMMKTSYDYGQTSKATTDIMVTGEGVLGGTSDLQAAEATVYKKHKSEQSPDHVAEKHNLGLVDQVNTEENDAIDQGPHNNMTIRRDDEPNYIPDLGLELSGSDLWDVLSRTPPREAFSYYGELYGI